MNLTIPLTRREGARLAAAAKQSGLSPSELMKRLAIDHLSFITSDTESRVDAKLRLWQEEDGAPLGHDVPTNTLFTQWAEEDARMTDEERDSEDRLWQDIENGQAIGIRLRKLVSGSLC